MPADITRKDGKDLVAVNWGRGHPWHELGVKTFQDMTIDQGLELVGVDKELITLVPLYERTIQQVASSHSPTGTGMETYTQIPLPTYGVKSSIFGMMATAGARFVPPQRREVLELAYAIEGLDRESAHLDTIGILGPRGEVFFSYIRVPDLVIDPNGIADVIERGVFAANSWDGSLSRVQGESSIRVVCSNTLSMALGNVKRLIKVRNTRNAEDRIKVAAEALQYAGMVDKAMAERAETMLKVDGDKAMAVIKDHFWDVKEDGLSDKAKTQRERKRNQVQRLYDGDGNLSVDYLGKNGWAAYNAFVEYQDHERDVTGTGKSTTRATAAVLPGKVQDEKVTASELILALAA